ncbi:MAG: hypothetical protein ABJQ14_12975, partial [Hyphomicrobiales bacterium]
RVSSTPPRIEVVSGLVRQDNFVTSRRFREDGLEAVIGGGGARVDTLGALALAKQTKHIGSDSLQDQVKPVVPTP